MITKEAIKVAWPLSATMDDVESAKPITSKQWRPLPEVASYVAMRRKLPTQTNVSAYSLVPMWTTTCSTKSSSNCDAVFNYRRIGCDAEGVGEASPTRLTT